MDGDRIRASIAAPRIVIERVSPCVDGGRFPAKGIVRRPLQVEADIFMDGHDVLEARLLWSGPGSETWQPVPMRLLGNDRWRASFTPTRTGAHRFTIEAWLDVWGTHRHALKKKHEAGVPTALEVEEGRRLVEQAALRAKAAEATRVTELARQLKQLPEAEALDLMLTDVTAAVMAAVDDHAFLTRLSRSIVVDVERVAAGFASWYELFPRSMSPDPQRHGTFDDVIGRLPAIQAMGFDVLYFTPIHPIGRKNRKGRNNSLTAEPGEPGSPYAIGSREGGHEAVHPELGGIEAFRRLRVAAAAHGLELALDFAIQCAPDHPWLEQHPGWFSWRPDGSLRYAENPPKKYQDIVNVDFYAKQALPDLWLALRDVVQGWVDEGVKIFRVDNPHTKPLPFWEWMIRDIRSRDPDVIFLSEAFTRPAMMYRLAKVGFTQSYTYFTWRNTKAELTEYLTELSTQAPKDFFRPNFFVNTPDINPTFLHYSGRPGFLIRAALATTLSGLWGLYSGFELCESTPLPGKEEYLDSEKYQLRHRDWREPGNIVAEISRLNFLRKRHASLQSHLGITFLSADNDQVLFYEKASPEREDVLLVAVSLDPRGGQHAHLDVPLDRLGIADDGVVTVEELMRDLEFEWRGRSQHWFFDPHELPFAIFRLRPAAGAA
ncbi:MAG TPA: alpha-1,4-glucan--maltose-1-phosphate maltosyltransferase [Nevskiaceae bacterium]|nr:alpha-1,4-glucan--maltose-1-phosphate maltosyltransferase [Nevskiaceae bacterium]